MVSIMMLNITINFAINCGVASLSFTKLAEPSTGNGN